MSLKDMPKEELEILSYTDLAYKILKENKKLMNTADIFKCICKLLDYSDDDYANKIADFYTSLTMDKRFVWLDINEWDLRENHSVAIVIDDEDEELEGLDGEDDVVEEEHEELDEDFEDDVDVPLEDDDLDDEDDDLDELAIVPDDEIEES